MANIERGYRPGCIGRVVQLHAEHYAAVAGFGLEFEAKVARELADFCGRHDAQRDGLWLAVDNGQIEGAIAIDGSHAGAQGAHLRWFIVSERARGSGVGSALLRAALDFCAARSYGTVFLWTFDGLHAARHLYEKHGFRLVRAQRGAQWGKEVDEQYFVKQDP